LEAEQLGSRFKPDPNPESDPKLITDPDPNLQIISDPSGSGCTTLPYITLVFFSTRANLYSLKQKSHSSNFVYNNQSKAKKASKMYEA
jgi:hypothetical protein